GSLIAPDSLTLPSLVILPARDRIVPPASAAALAALLPNATRLAPPLGHIGMIAGGGARKAVWQPLAAWLGQHGAGATWTDRARARRAGRGLGGHHGADSDGGRGTEPGPAGGDRRRHPGRGHRIRRQPALRLGSAHGGARLPGDPQRRFIDRRRRRPGEHEP